MKLKNLFFAAAAVLGVVACQNKPSVAEGVTVDPAEITFAKEGETKEVTITTADEWKLSVPEDLSWLEPGKDLSKIRAKAYDIVLNGAEIGGGSVRIHQSDIQEKMFECLGFTKEQASEQFSFLLNAFRYGVPPHAGLAYGLDRVVMMMLGLDSIRDVIAFPKVKDSSDLMTQAPGEVSAAQLEELGISILEKAQI